MHHAYDPIGQILYLGNGKRRNAQQFSINVISTVAGIGGSGLLVDGIPATQARLFTPQDVAVGPDGSLYIAEQQTARIRRVGPDGVITTVVWEGQGQVLYYHILALYRSLMRKKGTLYHEHYSSGHMTKIGGTL